jgi:hypothetical protein
MITYLHIYVCMYIYIYIYMCIYIYIYIYIQWERENKIVLVSLSEGTMGGGRGKENVKGWKTLLLKKEIMWSLLWKQLAYITE